MGDLVEKVARALCADNFLQVQGAPTTQTTIDEAWRDDVSGAKAAIAAVLDAIAEPSDAVILASDVYQGRDFVTIRQWRAMIAALRKEVE